MSRDPLRQQIAAGMLIALGLVCIAFPERAGGLLLHGAASRAAAERVDQALERNQDTFLRLSGAVAALAVVEGSAVGVGFDLQLGDVVQPILDLVQFFWRLLLFSLLLLGAYKLLLETGLLALGFAGLGAGLALWGTSRLVAGARGLLAASRLLILAGLLLAYLVPLALLTTHWLTENYTRKLEDHYRGDIAAFGRDLDRARESVLDPEVRAPWYRPGERMDDFRQRLGAAGRYLSERFDATLLSFTFYAILLLFDYLLLPFASAWLLYRLVALGFGRLFPG